MITRKTIMLAAFSIVAALPLAGMVAPIAPTIKNAQNHLSEHKTEFGNKMSTLFKQIAPNYGKTVLHYCDGTTGFSSVFNSYWYSREVIKQYVVDVLLMQYAESLASLALSTQLLEDAIVDDQGLAPQYKADCIHNLGNIFKELSIIAQGIDPLQKENIKQIINPESWSMVAKRWIAQRPKSSLRFNDTLTSYKRAGNAIELYIKQIIKCIKEQKNEWSNLHQHAENLLKEAVIIRQGIAPEQEDLSQRTIVGLLAERIGSLIKGLIPFTTSQQTELSSELAKAPTGSLIAMKRSATELHNIICGTAQGLQYVDCNFAVVAHRCAFEHMKRLAQRFEKYNDTHISWDGSMQLTLAQALNKFITTRHNQNSIHTATLLRVCSAGLFESIKVPLKITTQRVVLGLQGTCEGIQYLFQLAYEYPRETLCLLGLMAAGTGAGYYYMDPTTVIAGLNAVGESTGLTTALGYASSGLNTTATGLGTALEYGSYGYNATAAGLNTMAGYASSGLNTAATGLGTALDYSIYGHNVAVATMGAASVWLAAALLQPQD